MQFDLEESFLYSDGKIFNPAKKNWEKSETCPKNMIEVDSIRAIQEIQRSKNKIKTPIGVIGAGKPTDAQYKTAETLGSEIAKLGFSVICGGRAGVMEAVCKGVSLEGGTSIGILPESDTINMNPFVTIPIPTGIGFARNSIIITTSMCVVAVGGGFGTLSEIAYALQFNKKVFTLSCDWKIPETIACASVNEVIQRICDTVFCEG